MKVNLTTKHLEEPSVILNFTKYKTGTFIFSIFFELLRHNITLWPGQSSPLPPVTQPTFTIPAFNHLTCITLQSSQPKGRSC